MPPARRKCAFVCGGAVLFYVAMASLFLALLPQPRVPVHYMVAGAFATGVSLLAAFVCYILGFIPASTILRIVRRSAQLS